MSLARATRAWSWTSVTLVVMACAESTAPGAPRVLSTELVAPAPLVRTLRIELEQPAELTVEYWTEGDAHLRVQVPAAQSPTVTLTRLRPKRSYRYQIVGTSTGGTFASDTLPSDLADVVVSATGHRSTPLVLLHLYQPNGFQGFAILDEHDDVVWYWRTAGFPHGTTRRSNGNLVLMDGDRGLVEVSPAGTVVHELAQDPANREMHHDAIASPANTVLFIAFDDRVVSGATVRGEAIWEWSPESGATVKRWSAWDHFSLADVPAPGREWMHANSLAIGPRQNVLMSVHHWNQVISITADWRTIEWRLGSGPGVTHPVPAAEAFSGQHTARELAANRVVLFDNGIARGGYSRAVEYSLDAGAGRTLWEWRAQPLNYASAVGSARRLENGNTLVAYGMSAGLAGSTGPTEVYEVNGAGAPVWHLVTRTQVMYRAEPLTSISGESTVSPASP